MNRLQWAIYDAVHSYGVRELAELMRVAPQTLINKVNPELDTHQLTFDQFTLVLEATKSEKILSALADRAEMAPREDLRRGLTVAVLEAAKESGDVLAVFSAQAGDGHWSVRDADQFETEVNQAVEKLGTAVAESWALARSGGRMKVVA